MVSYVVMLATMIASALTSGTWRVEGVSGQFLNFVYYAGAFALTVAAAPSNSVERDQYARSVLMAIMVSAIGTGLIGVWQARAVLVSDFRLLPANVGLMYHRTHFGYLMALGFVTSLALSRGAADKVQSVVWFVVVCLAGYLTVFSMTRGAWLSALVFMSVVAVLERRPRLLLGLLPAMGFLQVPQVRARLVGEFSAGVAAAVQSGAAGSYRIRLWQTVWEMASGSIVFGRGFGFLRSVLASAYFGEGQMVTPDNPVLYAHNDVLFLLLETGVVGALAYVVAWAGIAYESFVAVRRVRGSHSDRAAVVALAGVGVLIVLTISQLVDNAFFVRSVLERCAAGFAAALVGVGVFEYPGEKTAMEDLRG